MEKFLISDDHLIFKPKHMKHRVILFNGTTKEREHIPQIQIEKISKNHFLK
mgnify:CR=1 FL=1